MGFIENLATLKALFLERDIQLQSVAVEEEKLAVYPQWYLSARLGQPRVNFNLTELRQFAKSEWVQMVNMAIKKAVQKTPHKIVLEDEESEEDIALYAADVDKINQFLGRVNQNGDNINDLNSSIVTDLLEIDAGVMTKAYSEASYVDGFIEMKDLAGNLIQTVPQKILKPFGKRELLQIFDQDGGMFFKNVDIYKRSHGYYQYSFKHPKAAPRWFGNDELSYFMMNRRPDSVYGWAPLQSIQQIIEVMIQSTRFNKEIFLQNLIPDALVFLKNANDESLKKAATDWKKNFKGKAHKLGFLNGDNASLVHLQKNLRDMEWLEGQKWYYHLVFGIYGVSPEEAGFIEDVNRSTQEGQERVTMKNAIKPYLDLLERRINNDIIPEILQKPDIKVKFKFFTEDKQAEVALFNQQIQEITIGAMTINEYRRLKGLDDVEWGETPGQGSDELFGQDPFAGGSFGNQGNPGDKEKDPKKAKEDKEKEKTYRNKFEKFLVAK